MGTVPLFPGTVPIFDPFLNISESGIQNRKQLF